MEHVRALIIKALMIGVITVAVLSMFRGLRPVTAIWIAIVITIAAYVLGDLLILPAYGNLSASISNGIIAFLITWLTPLVVPRIAIMLGTALTVGALVGIGEWFFHKYFSAAALDDKTKEV